MAKKSIPLATRRAVAAAAGCEPGQVGFTASCRYCGATGQISWFPLSNGKPGSWVHFLGLELDHVVAEAHGGSSEPDNIVLACQPCNRRKHTKSADAFKAGA